MIFFTLPLWGGSTRSVGAGRRGGLCQSTPTRDFAATSRIEGR